MNIDLKTFLENLKEVTASPYALVAYICVVAGWVYIVISGRRLKTIEKLPKEDQARVLEQEYRVFPKSGLSGEQWIRVRMITLVFWGFAMIIVASLTIGVVALVLASGKTNSTQHEPNDPKETKPDTSQPPKTPNGDGAHRSDSAPAPKSKPSPVLLKDSSTPEFARRELPPMVNDVVKMNLSQYYDVRYKGIPTNPNSDELLESWVRPRYPTGFPVVTIPVYVLLYVDSNGKVERALPILGERAFLVEAFNAALKWKYKQYVKDGQVVPEWKTIITIEFPTDTDQPN
jgi:hypothetical protein